MNRVIWLICVLCVSLHAADPCGDCNVTDCVNRPIDQLTNKHTYNNPNSTHTFLKPRGITTNNVFQHNLGLYWWYHDILSQTDCCWWMMEASAFYQRSTNAQSIAEFFFPCKKNAISVKQDGTGDVGSAWLNLVSADDTNFASCMSMRPQRSVQGGYFDFRFDLSRLYKRSWFDLSFAVMHARHELYFCQTMPENPGVICNLTTVAQALNQSSLHYGKFSLSPLTRTGIDTIQCKVGLDWFFCDTNHISPYILATAPGGTGGDLCYIFEPIIQTTHVSIGFGIIGDYKIIDHESKELTLLIDFKYRYELGATDKRSFDLCQNGAWSRYLKLTQETDPCCSFPAINLLTQDVRVIPQSVVDWWTALHYKRNHLNIEVGYDFWWRQQELIQLKQFAPGFGIYNIAGDCTVEPPVTASTACICQSIEGNVPQADTTFIAIAAEDINLNSGAMPRALSNTIYISCAYDGTINRMPVFIGFGGSYEKAHDAFSNLTVWVRSGLSF